jgi:hypothetical protein
MARILLTGVLSWLAYDNGAMSMKTRNLLMAGASALTFGWLGLGPASADIITQSLSAANSAISPYPGPYQTVTINRTSTTTATITFTSDFTVGGNIFLMGDDGSGAAAVNLTVAAGRPRDERRPAAAQHPALGRAPQGRGDHCRAQRPHHPRRGAASVQPDRGGVPVLGASFR